MKIRFQADADFNQNTVRAMLLHQRVVHVQTAAEAGCTVLRIQRAWRLLPVKPPSYHTIFVNYALLGAQDRQARLRS